MLPTDYRWETLIAENIKCDLRSTLHGVLLYPIAQESDPEVVDEELRAFIQKTIRSNDYRIESELVDIGDDWAFVYALIGFDNHFNLLPDDN